MKRLRAERLNLQHEAEASWKRSLLGGYMLRISSIPIGDEANGILQTGGAGA